MPIQPNPNPDNKPPQLLYHNEMANFPSYPINTVELDGVQLRSRKALKGHTITKVYDEPKEDIEKEPPFLDQFIPWLEPKEPTHLEFDILNELCNINIKIPLL